MKALKIRLLALSAGNGIHETTVSHVYYQVMMFQKISPEDRMCDIGYHEDPPKDATKAEIEREGSVTVGANGGVVDCLQCEVAGKSTVSGCRRDNADLSSGVNKKPHSGVTISDIKQATWVRASDVRRLYALASLFPGYEQGCAHLRALSPKRAWYQQMGVVLGCGEGERGR